MRISLQHVAGLWILCLMAWIQPVFSQQYFKVQEEADRYFHQKIARFPNGDILIGDSSLEAQVSGRNGKIYITRMDNCGQVIWSNSYGRTEEYLEFEDFLINAREEIFLYGSAFIGADELIFLLKLDGQGQVRRFLFLEPETVDHFAFSLDMKDGRLMAYGLLKGWVTPRQGFLAVFDDRLNFQWGKKFTPFDSNGEAVFSRDGGFICRSGPYLFKFDREGVPEWAKRLQTEAVWRHAAGPVETPGGYVLGVHKNNHSFLYHINQNGELRWKTKQFPATDARPDIKRRQNGQLLLSYIAPDAEGNRLRQLTVSPGGEILQHQQLVFDRYFQTSAVYQSIGDDNTITIAGNKDIYNTRAESIAGFLLQFTPGNETNDCFYWEDIQTGKTNGVILNFTDLTLEIAPTTLQPISTGDLLVEPFEAPFRESCTPGPEGNLIQQDTTLTCGETWTVTLPSPAFTWEDGYAGSRRELATPGTYRAGNGDCVVPINYEFHLARIPCAECPTFLPSAFSPNRDGVNDRLIFFSDCDLVQVTCRIYNRYGAVISESKDPANLWDGDYQNQPAQTGVYVAAIRYTWRDSEGTLREGTLYQDVTLVR